MAIDAVDAHDGQRPTKGHTGVAMLPALLASADVDRRVDGGEFLSCFVLGYEVATRAGIALHATVPDYHTSGAWNCLGAAAMGARLHGARRARLPRPLGIAEYYGPRSQMMRCIDHPTMLKDGSGWGAMAGVTRGLAGRRRLHRRAGGDREPPRGRRTSGADLGSTLAHLRAVLQGLPGVPLGPAGGEAVLAARPANLDPERVARIEIVTFHEGERLHVTHPTTTEQAQYSLPWPVACALATGTVAVDGITEQLGDPALARLAERVEIRESDDFNAHFPAERWASAVLHLDDGTRLESPACEARGNPTNPLDGAELRAKYDALAEPVLGERATRLREVVMSLETRPASDLLALLGAP